MKRLLILLLITLPCFADIKAINTDETFQERARIDSLEQIKINKVPRTTYTPSNLRSQYNIQFQGRNNQNGAMTVWSSPISDYDTKIIDVELLDNEYYIIDNTGKRFKTGEHFNTSEIDLKIEDSNNKIKHNTQSIKENIKNIQNLNNRIDNLQDNIYSGLATVSALTSLHPNPRSDSPFEISFGTGFYKDQVAGATGIFIHPTDNIMLQGACAIGNSVAGYAGVTFSLPCKKR